MPDFDAYELVDTDDAIAFEEAELKKLNTLFKMFGMLCEVSYHGCACMSGKGECGPGFDLTVWVIGMRTRFVEVHYYSDLKDLDNHCQGMITKFQNNEQVAEFF